jgi:hypothetical protein
MNTKKVKNRTLKKKGKKKTNEDIESDYIIKNVVEIESDSSDNENSEKNENILDINDDTLDLIEHKIEEINNTNNLGEKVKLHKKLTDTTTKLMSSVNEMVSLIDNIDNRTFVDESDSSDDEDSDSDSDTDSNNIDELDNLLNNMKDEDSLKKKIELYEKIIKKVQKVKKKCTDTDKMIITKCKE